MTWMFIMTARTGRLRGSATNQSAMDKMFLLIIIVECELWKTLNTFMDNPYLVLFRHTGNTTLPVI